MALRFPETATTARQRLAFLLRLKKRVEMLHNLIGLWHREGLSRAEWDDGVEESRVGGVGATRVRFPPSIRARFAYQPRITRAQFANMIGREFDGRMTEVLTAMAALEDQFHLDASWDGDIDLDRITEDV